MEKLLSISVAAYNVQAYIRKCLDSFLAPEILERVEVLITDDGSTDDTAKIVAEYVANYPNTFRLISQKNAGPGSTVNSGLAHATGKYFRTVDGDDWVNTPDMGSFLDALEKTNADMVCANYQKVDHETGQTELVVTGAEPCMDQEFEALCPALNLSMHHVTYKTALLKENQIRVDNCFYTDSEYLVFPIPYVRTVTVLDLTIYMYRVSLSTQSMNIHSLQRNSEMHRLVLGHLVDACRDYETSSNVHPNKARFLRKAVAGIAGMQLLIYLSMEDVPTYQKAAKQMVEEIRDKSEALYQTVKEAPTFHLLTASRFLLFPALSHRAKKRLRRG